MAATDYEIVKGCFNCYLAKKTKLLKNGALRMSMDRRPITDSEIIGLFEFYLRNWYEDHPDDDTLVIADDKGNKLFQATLLDKDGDFD